MGPEIFGTGRTGGKVGPEIFGSGSERVLKTKTSINTKFWPIPRSFSGTESLIKEYNKLFSTNPLLIIY